MAVVIQRDGHQQIAVFDAATGTLEAITEDQTDHWNPSISPDRKSIVCHKRTPGQTTPNVESWGEPPDTRLILLRVAGAFPAFSPDETSMALTGGSLARIDIMNVEGSQRHTIFEGERRTLFGVSWSCPAERVAFSHGSVFGEANASVNSLTTHPRETKSSNSRPTRETMVFPASHPVASSSSFVPAPTAQRTSTS